MGNLNDVAKRYYEQQLAADGTASENSGDLSDPGLLHFERQVLSDYGDTVSIADKAKGLTKFGFNTAVDQTLETVWVPGGNEVYCTTNAISHFSSSSGSDTVQMKVEGHTVSGTGADAQYTFVAQTITLNGQTKTALATPLARISRAYNIGATDLVGNIYFYEDDTVVAGVPQTAALLHLQVPAGFNQSFKAATTFSNTDYFALRHFHSSVARGGGTAVNVDFYLEVKLPGSVFRTQFIMSASSGAGIQEQTFDPPLIIPKNADIRVRAIATSNNTPCNAAFEGYIAKVVT